MKNVSNTTTPKFRENKMPYLDLAGLHFMPNKANLRHQDFQSWHYPALINNKKPLTFIRDSFLPVGGGQIS